MIELVAGDIFESGAEAMVNPVNCLGVSGAGLAKAFADRFPEAQMTYVRACKAGVMRIGTVVVASGSPKIIYFPTKTQWWKPSEPEYITAGLVALRHSIKNHDFASIAVPALGCGLGGLDWGWVHGAIEDALSDLRARVLLFEP